MQSQDQDELSKLQALPLSIGNTYTVASSFSSLFKNMLIVNEIPFECDICAIYF